jgi:hypothetical protein
MKKLLFCCPLALALLAVPSSARASGLLNGPWKLGITNQTTFSFGCQSYTVGGGLNFFGYPGCPGGPGGGGGGGAGAGPWYQYWPMEAHFQTPAPVGFPYGPSPMGLPGMGGYGGGGYDGGHAGYGAGASGGHDAPAATQETTRRPAPRPQAPFQPVGYYYQAPSYWYGR